MIEKLSLSNFKSFNTLDNLEIRNLTVIVGRNSCGKSSIMQSLLLLKQTLESESAKSLCMEGKYLKFSNLKEISHGIPAVNQASIGYDIVLSNTNTKEPSRHISFEFKNKKEGDIYSPALSGFCITAEEEKIDLDKLTKGDIEKIFQTLITHFSEEGSFESFEINYDKFLPDTIALYFKVEREGKKTNRTYNFPLFPIFDKHMEAVLKLQRTIKEIKYLSPLRAKPERAYVHYSQDVESILEDGSNSAHIFWAKRNKKVKWKGDSIALENAVNECIKTVGLNQEITPAKIGDILYQVGIGINQSKSSVSIADVGFGYSQILPIILLGLLSSKDNLMLIEQPEIHLHPSSAGNLADLFLAFAQDDKNFIIETHSQEFINKLRLRVIQNPELKKKINIVFVEQSESGSQIKQFEIDEEGMFPEWPQGFLDESESLARQILEARLGL
ncbi:DUF3696 domain-containing protein [Aeromonas veronii]|uniref:DUF3696 domain-containing protein n=1 Tax=Aeromonas veronii TaxID=654 RepID=UPI0031FDF791